MKKIQVSLSDEKYKSIADFACDKSISIEEALVALAIEALNENSFDAEAMAMRDSFEKKSKELVGYAARRSRVLSRTVS